MITIDTVKNWLSFQATLYKSRDLREITGCSDDIASACNNIAFGACGVQVADIIEICKFVGLEMQIEVQSEYTTYPFMVSVEYEGVKFFSVYSEKEIEEKGIDVNEIQKSES